LLLIVIQPGIEVNPVIDPAATEVNSGNAERLKQRYTHAEIVSGLLARQATGKRAGEDRLVHGEGSAGGIASVSSIEET
jgi:hypothetical protein